MKNFVSQLSMIYIPQEREYHNEENEINLILIQLGLLHRKIENTKGGVKVCFTSSSYFAIFILSMIGGCPIFVHFHKI